MKRVVSIIIVLMICIALGVAAFATSVGFIPSITAEPAPEVIIGDNTVKIDGTEGAASGEGETFVPVIEVKNETKDVVYTAPVVDLVVTAVSQVQVENAEETVAISEEAVKTLREAYSQLNNQNFKLSEESPELLDQMKEVLVGQLAAQLTKKLEEQGADTEAIQAAVAAATDSMTSNIEAVVDTAVVTALFDVSVLSEELNEYLNEDGNTVDLTFKADIPEDHHVIVMVFKENKWQTIENVIVNGDGTITCTFAHFCPVAILTVPAVEEEVEAELEAAPETEAAEPEAAETEAAPEVEAPVADEVVSETAEASFSWWWIVLVAVVVIVVVIVAKGKGSKKNAEVKK